MSRSDKISTVFALATFLSLCFTFNVKNDSDEFRANNISFPANAAKTCGKEDTDAALPRIFSEANGKGGQAVFAVQNSQCVWHFVPEDAKTNLMVPKPS